MRELSFKKATALSFIMHVVFLILTVAATRSALVRTPTVYVVRIVEPEALKTQKPSSPPAETRKAEESAEKESPSQSEDEAWDLKKYKTKKLKDLRAKQNEKYRSERLKEIESKLISERVKEMAASKGIRHEAPRGEVPTEAERSKILSDYINSIETKIRELWVFPDMDLMSLEAVISITVMETGAIRINRFERTSGDAPFDRSALKAIIRAGRVEPPPFGKALEIGIRFRPNDK